jgi:hypothetical protein
MRFQRLLQSAAVLRTRYQQLIVYLEAHEWGRILLYDIRYAVKLRFLLEVLLAACILFVENALVVIASAAQIPAEQNKPLIDYGRDYLRSHDKMNAFLTWSDDIAFFSFFEDNYILIGILTAMALGQMVMIHRVIRTLQVVRFMRWFTFTVTILPSGLGPSCQAEKGYDTLDLSNWTVGDWLRESILRPKTGGGCHDLLFSGHSVMYTLIVAGMFCMTPCFRTKWGRTIYILCTALLTWLVCPFATIRDGYHYTVDIIVAVYLTVLVFFFVPYSCNLTDPSLHKQHDQTLNHTGAQTVPYRRKTSDVELGVPHTC